MSTLLLRAGVDPDNPQYKDVEYILLDPSCSGSGRVMCISVMRRGVV
uniref:SAM-dependent MTase RsmB/NOP-type domain-containing protein n=1 Tax=Oreochromis aureus TaxID=47969 RepID=A0AAZ1WYH2_OREAU